MQLLTALKAIHIDSLSVKKTCKTNLAMIRK